MSKQEPIFLAASALAEAAVSIVLVTEASLPDQLAALTVAQQAWVETSGFKASSGQHCLLSDEAGALTAVLLAYDPEALPPLAAVMKRLPAGCYGFSDESLLSGEDWFSLYFMIAEAQYQYAFPSSEKANDTKQQRWVVFDSVDLPRLHNEVQASHLARRLINTPANHMQPMHLAAEAEQLAKTHGASFRCVSGEELLDVGYRGTHTVGAAGEQPPCMIDFIWGNPDHPSITLVGKGVCFDSGGLSLKPSRSMETMKKDMGGAAHVLALAQLIMSQQLPVSLRVLIPAAENGIGKGAYRLGDVIQYSNGTVVEITNTDAEGRLILADALLEAVSEGNPDLLIDFATLTGAARVAVGMDMGSYFSNQERFLQPLLETSRVLHDPIWPLPLYRPYKKAFDSEVGDLTNAASDGYAGATKAALFLAHFVPDDCPWIHFDVAAWTTSSYRGLQKGASVQGLRSVYRFLESFVANT